MGTSRNIRAKRPNPMKIKSLLNPQNVSPDSMGQQLRPHHPGSHHVPKVVDSAIPSSRPLDRNEHRSEQSHPQLGIDKRASPSSASSCLERTSIAALCSYPTPNVATFPTNSDHLNPKSASISHGMYVEWGASTGLPGHSRRPEEEICSIYHHRVNIVQHSDKVHKSSSRCSSGPERNGSSELQCNDPRPRNQRRGPTFPNQRPSRREKPSQTRVLRPLV
jgi:hypothetical protein